MERKSFRGIELSRLGMGNMRLPRVGDAPDGEIDYGRAEAIIDYAMASGINYYDTAWMYHGGKSEEFLGRALVARYPRNSFYVATKFHYQSNHDYKYVFNEQLRRLGTDHIDFYLCHAVMDNVYKDYLDCGCIDYLLEQRAAGRIRYLGFSSHATPQVLRIFADSYGRPWDFVQIQCNYYDWRYSTTREEYEILRDRGIPIMVMEPVRGGRLAQLTPEAERPLRAAHPDWTPASWALRWVRSLPQVQTVLSGMSTLGQIQNNVATFSDEESLSERDKGLLERACETFHDELSIPCTACRYCTDTCPAGIDIPQVLALANKVRMGSQGALRDIRKVEGGQPEDCVGCAQCTEHCPQGIDTPAVMAEMSERLATAGV